MFKKTKSKILLVAIIGVALVVYVGLSNKKSEATLEAVAYKTVKLDKIVSQTYTENLEYTGYVDSVDQLKLAFETSGKVSAVNVKEGQAIEAGQALISLNKEALNRSLESEKGSLSTLKFSILKQENVLEQMSLQLEMEKTKYENTKALYEAGSISKSDFEAEAYNYNALELNYSNSQYQLLSAKENYSSGQLSVQQAEQNLENTDLISPMAGLVVSVDTELNQMVSAGTTVITIQSKKSMIRISVPVTEYKYISEGQNVEINASDEDYQGVIDSISLVPDQTTRTYQVDIIPDAEGLLFSSIVEVKIPIEVKTGYFVSLGAIVNIDGINYVYELKKTDDQNLYEVSQFEVELGKIYNDRILLENVNAEINVATEGVKNIKVNDLVEIIQ